MGLTYVINILNISVLLVLPNIYINSHLLLYCEMSCHVMKNCGKYTCVSTQHKYMLLI